MSRVYNFMSVKLATALRKEVLEAVQQASPDSRMRIATPNPEFIIEARHNPAFQEALATMTHCIIDGVGLFYMMKLWQLRRGKLVRIEKYQGADLVADLFEANKNGEKSFFFLGGPLAALEQARETILRHYPAIHIVGVADPGKFSKHNVTIDPTVVKKIQHTRPDIVLIGLGAPKQELWINQAKEILDVPVMIGVGGTFDFYSRKPRAPKLIRTLNLEWAYRMVREVNHWKRIGRILTQFLPQSVYWILRNQE